MELKPQDIYVALKLVARGKQPWTYNLLSLELAMSASEVNAAVKRAQQAGLIRVQVLNEKNPQPIVKAIEEFIFHGLKYSFPPDLGGMVRGMPTAYAAPGLGESMQTDGQPPHVWPWESGAVRGLALSPLYPTAPQAAHADSRFHQMLALVDCLRISSPRGTGVATNMLKDMLASYGKS
jgi:hypothetical protein